ncbi:MAG: hypothetical protein GXO02_00305 [Epsilonproteobacteria bacterium]|nr:hypothetical protein [Campylobacterota bacterium]
MENLDFIKYEMLTHIPINTHKEPKSILLIESNQELKEELNKYKLLKFEKIVEIKIDQLQNIDEKFDLIIINVPFKVDKTFWIEITKRLNEDGLISTLMSNLFTESQKAKEELKIVTPLYNIVMPYRYDTLDNKLTTNYMLLLSKLYHPTADINLQRAELTDGFKYYNSDIAICSFSLPTFIYKEFLGIIKR